MSGTVGVEQGTAYFRDRELCVIERRATTFYQAAIERIFMRSPPLGHRHSGVA
jgi:hypothetical protein